MPKRPGSVLARMGNLAKGVVEHLSLKKKKRKMEDKEKSIRSTATASGSVINLPVDNSSDVFLAHTASDLAHSPLPNPEMGFYYHSGPLMAPEEKHNSSFHVFTLPPPRPRRATVEEVPDEDDTSIFTRTSIFTYMLVPDSVGSDSSSVDDDDLERDLQEEMTCEGAAGE
ncbi:hypothetical protein B0H10DRAFT_2237888 [Mycena sp. CBHHK59/15]|nr:hypothetical protein B0H10DRAFT_2237888 [Mycena sp. CBHHK59/15]